MRANHDKDVRKIVEKALEDFADHQVNLSSKPAREAIAVRIASDIITKYELFPETVPFLREP